MLLTKRKSFNPSRVVKLHRRPHRHQSLDNHNLSLQKSYTGPTRIVRLNIRPSNKISPPKDDKILFPSTIKSNVEIKSICFNSNRAMASAEYLIFNQSDSIHTSTQNKSPDHISPTRATDQPMDLTKLDLTSFNGSDFKTSGLCSNLTQSHVSYGKILNHKKKQKKRKKSCSYCCPCTPLCVILSMIATLLLAIVITTILIGVLIKTKLSTSTSSEKSTTTTTTPITCNSSCLNQTWISSSGLLAKWTFNGTYLDDMNSYTAIPVNSPTFITNGYVNQALSLTTANNQYLYTSYIPLIHASFTIELWLYPTAFPNPIHHSILGLCTYPGNDQCLHLTIQKIGVINTLYMSFFGDNCMTYNSVPLNEWTHAAFVFDNSTRSMLIYQNGYLIGNATSVLSLQGTMNNVTIGYIPGIVAAYGNNSFEGYIDQLTIFDRAKPACEILDDASLTTYYNFDSSPIFDDSGSNSLPSTSQLTSFVLSGHSSKAITFNNPNTYLQIDDLTELGTTNKSFSISLWIRPYSLAGTLVFVSSTAAGIGWCMSFIGFASNGSIVAQMIASTVQSVYGPAVSTSSIWHHIVETWSSTNGLRLYVDNVLVASSISATTYLASSMSNYVMLANRPNNTCDYGAIGLQGAFIGDIDDFKIYSRELTIDDVCALYKS